MTKKPPPPDPFKDELKKKLAAMKKEEDAKKGAARAPAKPLPRTISKPLLPPEKPKSDEELFLDAVKGVDQDAVLKKYDETPPPAPKAKPPEEKKREDEALFESFVGPVDKKRP